MPQAPKKPRGGPAVGKIYFFFIFNDKYILFGLKLISMMHQFQNCFEIWNPSHRTQKSTILVSQFPAFPGKFLHFDFWQTFEESSSLQVFIHAFSNKNSQKIWSEAGYEILFYNFICEQIPDSDPNAEVYFPRLTVFYYLLSAKKALKNVDTY